MLVVVEDQGVIQTAKDRRIVMDIRCSISHRRMPVTFSEISLAKAVYLNTKEPDSPNQMGQVETMSFWLERH